MSRFRLWAIALFVVAAAVPGFAQGTTGTLEGKVTDEQGLALPGVAVTAQNTATGFQRSSTSDTTGAFRVPGLPVGIYEVKAELAGFAGQARRATINVAATTSVDFGLTVATKTEEVTVVAEAPLIDSTESGVGEIITQAQIANLPLNGRQFANLAALVPGVSLGFHTDPTKSTQYAPQVSGGGGRNINYLIDGGDNNDDTVGGLVQLFPLDSIGEFNFETQRFRADTGRANGGTLKVVTKSGTNEFKGSVFEFFRDKSLNAKSHTEDVNNLPKGDYRRNQFGASLGGPIVRDRTHFFAAFERIQQDTSQAVSTKGLFPDKDGVFPLAYRENMAVAKLTHQLNPSNYLTVRYGFNNNTQPYGTSPSTPPESWGTNKNKFHSINANLNSVLGSGRLNEFVFQFSYFHNHIGENSTLPTETFPNGVQVGQSINTPQTTDQHKYQFRDDFTWTKGRHEFKVGASLIYEPVLDITFNSGQSPLYIHLTDSRTSPISQISYSGLVPGAGGQEFGTIPNTQYGLYIQDGWKVNDKLTLDLGVRYDLVTGYAADQSNNIIFAELQAAARAGILQRSGLPCPCPGFEDFGKEPAEDKNNVAPRAGFTYDVQADGRFVLRGGVGRYYDFAYTNANLLFPVYGAQVPFGQIYLNTNTSGIRNPDGTLFVVGQPLPPNQLTNISRPIPSGASSPIVKQPYTDQANLGFSKALGSRYAIEIDGVWAKGNDQGIRPRLNVRINNGPRRFAGILPQSGNSNFRTYITEGESRYRGVSFTVKRRWDGKLQVLASYTLADARSSTSRRATDEFGDYDVIDAFLPFADTQFGPTRTDARHRVTASAVWSPGGNFTIAPIFRYKSKMPFNAITGFDDNQDGTNFDLPAGAATVNSRRGDDFSQLDVRLSKKFRVSGRTNLEVIAEGFNLFNNSNPTYPYVENMRSATFGQATRFAGDFRQSEQRLFQIGARIEF
jgi:carboxypeptidase family protein/TonB-dependent receptor-like protein